MSLLLFGFASLHILNPNTAFFASAFAVLYTHNIVVEGFLSRKYVQRIRDRKASSVTTEFRILYEFASTLSKLEKTAANSQRLVGDLG